MPSVFTCWDVCFLFSRVEKEAVVPRGRNKTLHFLIFFLKKKKSASAFDATLPRHVLPLPKRLVVRDNCFCCITISSPGITAFPAILQCCPFTHTHTHYVDTRAGTCYHHNLAVFSSPLLVMLSETVYLFAHLFLVTRQHRKVCKCLCVCL